jgi:hypothetical protein
MCTFDALLLIVQILKVIRIALTIWIIWRKTKKPS